jgi:bifunctional non-homologous end joining protein LigD
VSEIIEIGNISFEAGNLAKIMFPKASITQRDLLDYYLHIAEIMLPHLRDRPVSLQRFPDGIQKGGFYQKEAPDYFPEWIERVSVDVEDKDAQQSQIMVNNAATLAYLADQGCITLHPWLSRAGALHKPDKLIIDLDPPSDEFEAVRTAAFAIRELLGQLELVPFVMTTGSKGLHVVVPLNPEAEFDEVRSFARGLAELLAARQSDQLTTEVRKNKREGRLFLDYLRNAYGQTSVAPYTVRAKEGAPVAVPLDWDELKDRSLHSQSYTLKNILRRMGQKDDPWQHMWAHSCSLDKPRKLLEEMNHEIR